MYTAVQMHPSPSPYNQQKHTYTRVQLSFHLTLSLAVPTSFNTSRTDASLCLPEPCSADPRHLVSSPRMRLCTSTETSRASHFQPNRVKSLAALAAPGRVALCRLHRLRHRVHGCRERGLSCYCREAARWPGVHPKVGREKALNRR